MSSELDRRQDKLQLFEQEFEIIKFRDLPVQCRMAVVWHMAVDGDAWSDVIDHDVLPLPEGEPDDYTAWDRIYKKVIEELLPQFAMKYGDIEYGFAIWDTNSLLKAIAGDEGFQEYGIEGTRTHFQAPIQGYHTTEYPDTDRWPVIMSDSDYETIRDGWHRFHIYVSNGHADIPVIFHPEEWHYELKAQNQAKFSGPTF